MVGNLPHITLSTCFLVLTGNFKRKRESKKTRKHALVQENTHSSKKKRTRSRPRKRLFFIVFFVGFLVESVLIIIVFLERVLFSSDGCVYSWTSACFLVFFYKFPAQEISIESSALKGNVVILNLQQLHFLCLFLSSCPSVMVSYGYWYIRQYNLECRL